MGNYAEEEGISPFRPIARLDRLTV